MFKQNTYVLCYTSDLDVFQVLIARAFFSFAFFLFFFLFLLAIFFLLFEKKKIGLELFFLDA